MEFLAKALRAKLTIYSLIILLGLWPVVAYLQHNTSLAGDPLKYLLHHMGFCACILLAVVLTLTPLRVIWPQAKLSQALNRHRRLIGVSAFVYACIHLALHVLYEGGFGTLAKDIKKPFIVTGMIAFTILLVLAITSTNAAIRRLGKRWKPIHRFAYLAAGLVAYHQAAARKLFPVQVLWIFIPLALLEVTRLVIKSRRETAPNAVLPS